jgi:hypothetical protein
MFSGKKISRSCTYFKFLITYFVFKFTFTSGSTLGEVMWDSWFEMWHCGWFSRNTWIYRVISFSSNCSMLTNRAIVDIVYSLNTDNVIKQQRERKTYDFHCKLFCKISFQLALPNSNTFLFLVLSCLQLAVQFSFIEPLPWTTYHINTFRTSHPVLLLDNCVKTCSTLIALFCIVITVLYTDKCFTSS